MTTCTRCAISEWHPEARTCSFGDCPFRAELPATGGAPAGRTGGREAGHVPVRHLYSSRRRGCAAVSAT